MARINVEQRALSDPRYRLLAKLAGLADEDHALGRMIRVWNECQEQESYTLDYQTISSIFGSEDAPGWLMEAHLADRKYVREKCRARICGTRGRIEWLSARRSEGRSGGRLGGRPPSKPLWVDGPSTPRGLRTKTPPAPAPAPALTEPVSEIVLTGGSGGGSASEKSRSPAYSAGFNEFWAKYPKRIGKGKAWSAWRSAHLDNGQLAEVMAGLGRWLTSQQFADGYIVAPAVWINQRRWEDEPAQQGTF